MGPLHWPLLAAAAFSFLCAAWIHEVQRRRALQQLLVAARARLTAAELQCTKHEALIEVQAGIIVGWRSATVRLLGLLKPEAAAALQQNIAEGDTRALLMRASASAGSRVSGGVG